MTPYLFSLGARLPIGKRAFAGREVTASIRTGCAEHRLGSLPDNREKDAA